MFKYVQLKVDGFSMILQPSIFHGGLAKQTKRGSRRAIQPNAQGAISGKSKQVIQASAGRQNGLATSSPEKRGSWDKSMQFQENGLGK